MGYSRRTIVRWTGNRNWQVAPVTQTLARVVYSADRELAARFAAMSGDTLQSLAGCGCCPRRLPLRRLHPRRRR